MPRNLVVCLDGTAARARGTDDSNVVRLYESLDLSDPSKQVAYYDPGVGTFSSGAAWTPLARGLSKLAGNLYGAGLRQNLGEAYAWLMHEWQPGDRIYVFGFSRGAYTARALVGFLRTIGLMRPGAENLLPYAVDTYARRSGEGRLAWDELHRFSALFSRRDNERSTVPVTYLGLWDTVKAAGILKWDIHWPYTRVLPNAARIRHAVSIDERRRPFREYLVEPADGSRLEEAWFAGVHCDVGGTYPDDPRLATIALLWVLDAAVEEGLLVVASRLKRMTEMQTDAATAVAHRNGTIWVVLIPRPRRIPPGAAVHSSVQQRILTVSGYRPLLPNDATTVE